MHIRTYQQRQRHTTHLYNVFVPVLITSIVSPRASTKLFAVSSVTPSSSVEVAATEPCAKRIRTRAKCRYNRPIVQGGRPEPLKTGTSYIVVYMNDFV
jgi:hypothetical protein